MSTARKILEKQDLTLGRSTEIAPQSQSPRHGATERQGGRRRGLLLAAGAVVILLGSGFVACSPSHKGNAGTQAAPDVTHSSSETHFTSYSATDGATSNVILTGAIGDYGTATRNAASTELRLSLAKGGFGLDIATLEDNLKAAFGKLAVNQQSCSAEVTSTGSVSVVPNSGTGSYANLSGSIAVTATLDEVYHPGGCQESDPYASQLLILTGWGTLTKS